MAVEVTITFQGVPPSPALRREIEERAAKLARFAPTLQTCDVAVRREEHHHHQGNRYGVHARLALPGGRIEAGRTPREDHSHEDPYLAVRDTFDALRRQLEDHVRIRRGKVKAHPPEVP